MMAARWLLPLVVASSLLTGCCSGSGPDRLLFVEINDDVGALRQAITFDGSDNEMPSDAFFQPYRSGGPSDGKLTTIPMLQLFDAAGAQVSLERFSATNEGGCAETEIFDPGGQLTVAERFTLVHRAGSSPGDLSDSGTNEGDLARDIVDFRGERALVAVIVVVDR